MIGPMTMSLFPVICTLDLDVARDFYCRLLGLDVAFESGWYTLLRHPHDPLIQLGFVEAGHPTVPATLSPTAGGVLVTVEVPNVDEVHQRAVASGAEIVLALRSEEFGQRHFMAKDPTGLLLDVVTPIAPSRSFLREVARWRRANR